MHKHFGGFRAVDGASIEIATGSITGLIGPNGAGKTTIFNMIAGSVRPTEGKVYLENDRVTPFHDGAALLALRAVKDKRQTPGWTHQELRHGPDGLC